jgi:hypothetical protein
MVALAWLVIGRTAGIFAAGFFTCTDLILGMVAFINVRALRRAAVDC